MKTMPQFQTQVRHPLTDHLPELLSAGRLRDPTIGILLLVLIRKNRLKGSAMQVESNHVGRGKSDWRQSREEEWRNTTASRVTPMGAEVPEALWVATMTRIVSAVPGKGIAGQSKSARQVPVSGWVNTS